MCEELIECPICNKKLKSLTSHIPFIHRISIEDFKKSYPEVKRLQLNLRKKGEYICDYCGKQFDYKNCLQIHIKHFHKDNFVKLDKYKPGHRKFICEVCNKKTNQLYNHVLLKHQINWDDYCDKYHWDGSIKSYFSEDHINTLSVNKKFFYSTERGLQLREEQSVLYSGDGNPAKNTEVRAKISLSAAKRCQNGEATYSRYGIHISFEIDGRRLYSRSFEEFKTILLFLKNKVDFEYEKVVVKYKDENNVIRNYVLDFLIDKKYMVEMKCDNKRVNYFEIHKYKQIRDILSRVGKEFIILNNDEICERFGLTPLDRDEAIVVLKNLLDTDKAKVFYIKGRNRKSRILEKVDSNYKSHRNIMIKGENNEQICTNN